MRSCPPFLVILVLAFLIAGCSGQSALQGTPGPQGIQGDPGPKGPPGDKGPTGDKGATGDKGPSGDKGPVGDMGPSGNKGPAGDKGPSGDKGAIGDKGPQGSPGPAGSAGDAVGKPSGLPPYQIVAAGMLRGDGTSDGPVFNSLRLTRGTGQGEVILGFNGYVKPAGAFQYIVKASVVSGVSGEFTVLLSNFRTEGVVLVVRRNGTAVPTAQLAQVELMVEISKILGN